jgi:hypothetical protein
VTSNVNRKSLYLFVLVISSTSLFLGVGWVTGLVFGGVWSLLLATLGGWLGAAIGGEIGHHKRFFEADWDRLVMGGPWMGYGVGAIVGSMTGAHSWMIALSAVLGAGIGVLISKYLLRFFVDDPPLSIK